MEIERQRFCRKKRTFVALAIYIVVMVVGYAGQYVWGASGAVGQDEDPVDYLKRFKLVPDSVAVVEGRFVMALFQNSETGQFVIVLFAADCDYDDCSVGEIVGLSLFDGQLVNLCLPASSGDRRASANASDASLGTPPMSYPISDDRKRTITA